MNLTSTQFSVAGQKADFLRIKCNEALDGVSASQIRSIIDEYILYGFPAIYIDAKDVIDTDLSGINEIIHSHYSLAHHHTRLVFIYRGDSAVEKWVQTTGLNRFVQTGIIPNN